LWFWSVLGVDGNSRCGQAWEEFERAEKMSCCIGSCAPVNPFVLQTRLLTTDAFSCLYFFPSVYFLILYRSLLSSLLPIPITSQEVVWRLLHDNPECIQLRRNSRHTQRILRSISKPIAFLSWSFHLVICIVGYFSFPAVFVLSNYVTTLSIVAFGISA